MLLSKRCFISALFVTMAAGFPLAADQTQAQKAWNILDAGVKDKSFTKRHDAIHFLGIVAGDAKAAALAEKALDDHIPEVREAAATTLGELRVSSSIPKLELALNDKDITVVLAAAHSLWELGQRDAYEVYYEILLGERKAGPGLIAEQKEMFRDRKKLAAFAFEQGIEFNPFAGIGWGIIKTVHQDDVSPVRASAARILIDDPDPRSGQALARSCSSKSWIVRVAALDALARRDDPEFIKDIEPHTTDENDRVRYTAAAAIIRLSGASPKSHAAAEEGSAR